LIAFVFLHFKVVCLSFCAATENPRGVKNTCRPSWHSGESTKVLISGEIRVKVSFCSYIIKRESKIRVPDERVGADNKKRKIR
ncbi:hypothetical protein KCV03_g397, partial [Aureobasidium melanogenum]